MVDHLLISCATIDYQERLPHRVYKTVYYCLTCVWAPVVVSFNFFVNITYPGISNVPRKFSKPHNLWILMRFALSFWDLVCSYWMVLIQTQTTLCVPVSFTHELRQWAAFCDWNLTSRPRYVCSLSLQGLLGSC